MPELTDRQRAWADYYVGPARFSVKEAARYVGVRPEQASRWRSNAHVQEYIEQKCKDMCDRWLVSSERWLAEVLSLAMSDPTDVLPDDGTPITAQTLKELPPQVRAAIRELSVRDDGTVQVKMHSKEGPLRMLGEYMALLKRQGRTPAGDPPPDAEDGETGVLLGLQMVGPGAQREEA